VPLGSSAGYVTIAIQKRNNTMRPNPLLFSSHRCFMISIMGLGVRMVITVKIRFVLEIRQSASPAFHFYLLAIKKTWMTYNMDFLASAPNTTPRAEMTSTCTS